MFRYRRCYFRILRFCKFFRLIFPFVFVIFNFWFSWLIWLSAAWSLFFSMFSTLISSISIWFGTVWCNWLAELQPLKTPLTCYERFRLWRWWARVTGSSNSLIFCETGSIILSEGNTLWDIRIIMLFIRGIPWSSQAFFCGEAPIGCLFMWRTLWTWTGTRIARCDET